MKLEMDTTRRRLRSKGTMRRRITNPVVKINTDAISAILIPIYNALPKTLAAGQHNLTYGEVEWATLKRMMDSVTSQEWLHSSPGKFYDLGCGRGRAVLFMALSGIFDQSVGIEVLPERIKLAQQALGSLRTSLPNMANKVKLFEASFTNPAFKYKDARLVFLSNFCFDNETQEAIFTRLNAEMPKGSLMFCSRMPARTLSGFETLSTEHVPMTWSPSSEIHILRHL